ncbi:MAG: hypothetical protein K5768_09170 [Firmicutes bacterium]|jgi:hypothetical protein|nr:hypothetical protein [Bacillota bacterium]
MSDYSQFVPKVHFEQIPIKNLVSNQDYQRNLSVYHVEKVAENFDLYQINPVKVSRRDGINYVFDGQHTIETILLVSGSQDTPVWCMVYDDLTYEHEADIFANQMKYTKKLQPYEIFCANIEAGNHDQQMIKELVESYGLTIGTGKAPGVISAVSTLESIYFKYGVQVLNHVLRLCVATWEGDINSFSANILNAIAKLIVTYRDTLDDEVFIEKIGAISPKTLGRTAHDRRPGSLGYAEAMIIAYNGKRKNPVGKLFMNKLYSKDYYLDEDNDDSEFDYDDENEEI